MLFSLGMLLFTACAIGIPTLFALWGALYVVAIPEEIDWASLILIVLIYSAVILVVHYLIASITSSHEKKKRQIIKQHDALHGEEVSVPMMTLQDSSCPETAR